MLGFSNVVVRCGVANSEAWSVKPATDDWHVTKTSMLEYNAGIGLLRKLLRLTSCLSVPQQAFMLLHRACCTLREVRLRKHQVPLRNCDQIPGFPTVTLRHHRGIYNTTTIKRPTTLTMVNITEGTFQTGNKNLFTKTWLVPSSRLICSVFEAG